MSTQSPAPRMVRLVDFYRGHCGKTTAFKWIKEGKLRVYRTRQNDLRRRDVRRVCRAAGCRARERGGMSHVVNIRAKAPRWRAGRASSSGLG